MQLSCTNCMVDKCFGSVGVICVATFGNTLTVISDAEAVRAPAKDVDPANVWLLLLAPALIEFATVNVLQVELPETTSVPVFVSEETTAFCLLTNNALAWDKVREEEEDNDCEAELLKLKTDVRTDIVRCMCVIGQKKKEKGMGMCLLQRDKKFLPGKEDPSCDTRC